MLQKEKPIFVVISNPPYNSCQANGMDKNKNRKYEKLEREISLTYAKDSNATLKNKLGDPYVKAIKWASQRIEDEGIIAMITNNSFLDNVAFDGMRKHLAKDFDKIYHINLKGNARTSGERRRMEKGNVFEDKIRVSVGLTFFIKHKVRSNETSLYYAEVDDYLTSEQKKQYLVENKQVQNIDFKELIPDKNNNWLTEDMMVGFDELFPIGDPDLKGKSECKAIFNLYSCGVLTARDEWVYNFHEPILVNNIKKHIRSYNSEVERWRVSKPKSNDNLQSIVENFVTNDEGKIKWTDRLLTSLLNGQILEFQSDKLRNTIYRPFIKEYLYFDNLLNQRRYQQHKILPTSETEKENIAICLLNIGCTKPFHCLITNVIPDYHLTGDSQCFPLYTYNEDGTNRKDNITDHALSLFTSHYALLEKGGRGVITKLDIFYYVYAILHHPKYRTDYAANLKRELPRIPFAPDFWAFSKAGKTLADLHLNYETATPHELEKIIDKEVFKECGFRIEKMRFNKDKTQLAYNDAITFVNIPKDVFEYKLGNRSALEWIVDQYQVTIDKRSGITNDPNNFDGNERYIFDLIRKIVTVSLKTVEIVNHISKFNYKS